MTVVHKKHVLTRDVWDLACERAAKCFKRFDTVAVWFSGGKDSTATLHVMLEAARALNRLPLQVAFWDEEAIPPDTVEYCERVRATLPVEFKWLCLEIQHRNACSTTSPWWYPWDHTLAGTGRLTRDVMPDGAIVGVPGFDRIGTNEAGGYIYPPQEYGQVCSVMGIRTQESLNRYQAIAGKVGHDAFFSSDHWRHITRAYPVYDWTYLDVWFAANKFGWDHNTAYDKMHAAGVPLAQQRCSPPFGEQPLERLWTYHVCWLDLWDRMSRRVPGANTAARYARTSLYAYGTDRDAVKPDAMSWRDFAYQRLERFPKADQAHCAASLRRGIRHHLAKSDEPLPDAEPDPRSGLSWKVLAQIAMRGDLKGPRKMMAAIAKANKSVKKSKESAGV
jgi:predicted phosphoadenosine phosphosulfate sulfurtransferase